MMNEMVRVVCLGLISWCVSWTLTRGKLFRWLRYWASLRLDSGENSNVWILINEFLVCTYCVMHWVAVPLVLVVGPRLIVVSGVFWGFVLNWLLVVSVGTLVGLLMDLVMMRIDKNEYR